MKVLWFTNTTVNLNKNAVHGGWMQMLEKQIVETVNIELFIAAKGNGSTIETIKNGVTTYMLIPDKRNVFKKRLDIFLNREPTNYNISKYIEIIDKFNLILSMFLAPKWILV